MTSDGGKHILAILQRNDNGEFAQVDKLYASTGENLLMIPTPSGIIVVTGEIYPQDELILSRLIETLATNAGTEAPLAPLE